MPDYLDMGTKGNEKGTERKERKMTQPTIHMGGTSRWQLADQYSEAASAVRTAIAKNKAAAPNPRDYYTQGPEAFSLAMTEGQCWR
jgi:hypothetical protein